MKNDGELSLCFNEKGLKISFSAFPSPLFSSLRRHPKHTEKKLLFFIEFSFLVFFPSSLEILPETHKSVVISVVYEIIFYRFLSVRFSSDSSSCTIIAFLSDYFRYDQKSDIFFV